MGTLAQCRVLCKLTSTADCRGETHQPPAVHMHRVRHTQCYCYNTGRENMPNRQLLPRPSTCMLWQTCACAECYTATQYSTAFNGGTAVSIGLAHPSNGMCASLRAIGQGGHTCALTGCISLCSHVQGANPLGLTTTCAVIQLLTLMTIDSADAAGQVWL